MANIITDNKHYTDIANAIRDKAQTTDTYKPEEMAEAIISIETVSDFWDKYQDNGNRLNYEFAFAGWGWNDSTFKPKYDIKPTQATNIFTYTKITDLVKLLNDAGVVLDLSKDTGTSYLVQGSAYITTLPTLNLTSRRNVGYCLSNDTSLRSVEMVVLKDDGTQTFNAYSFAGLPKLEEIRFSGTIGNSVEIKDSPLLSLASLQSIIDALKDVSGGTQQTLTLHADAKARLTDAMMATISAKNWKLG